MGPAREEFSEKANKPKCAERRPSDSDKTIKTNRGMTENFFLISSVRCEETAAWVRSGQLETNEQPL